MKSKRLRGGSRIGQISLAVAAALYGAAAVRVQPALAADAAQTSGGATPEMLREVIVTAQRRSENIQNVPIAIQAITGRTLQELNVQTFSDFVKYVPNVTFSNLGPGQGDIFMRGLSVGSEGTQASGSVFLFPNVAVYLDNESVQLPGRNLDVYAADMQRIEVDEGPQGTLFGAGAQAGVIRYITNQPQLDRTEVNINAGYGTTAHGGQNSNANATLNLPVLAHKLAVRLVMYTDNRGGYIDNLPATFSRSGTDLGIANANGGVVPINSVSIDNLKIAGRDINPVTYSGLRASALWKLNDDWDLLIEQSYQDMNAQGVFYQMPFGSEGTQLTASGVPFGGQPLPPLSVNLFNNSFDKDRFENTALTVDGKMGPLRLVYAGSYLVRNIEQVGDYTNYARGRYGYYYQCTGFSYYSTVGYANATCYSPSETWHDVERNTHLQQEVRLSTPDSWRLRGIVGLFYEDEKVYDNTNWLYTSVPDCSPSGPTSNCFLPIAPPANETANDRSVRSAATSFFDDFVTTFTQKAAFMSVDYDIVPRVLTITGGIRYFDMYNELLGGSTGGFGCKQFSTPPQFGACPIPPGENTNLDTQNPHSQVATGHLGRADLSWHVTQDALLYYTYSQGYRPGGFNRSAKQLLPDANGVPQYITPKIFGSDLLTNNELGWKSLWFDHRLQINGALYQENWSNVQTAFFCPSCGFGNVTFHANGPFYRVRGAEIQLAARPMRGLTVQGSAAWNSSELINSPALINDNPASSGFGKPVTTRYVNGTPLPVVNVYGTKGDPLAFSPPFEANMRVRYDWQIGDYQPYIQLGFQHQGHTQSATGFLARYDQPGWTTYDASLGIAKDAWTASLVGTNLTDVNRSLFTNSLQFILAETPMRPRVIGLTLSYQFSQRH